MPSNADPINPIKFWAISIFGLFCLTALCTNAREIALVREVRVLRKSLLAVVIFVLALVAALIFTDVKSIALVGYTGRNNGFITYLFLAIIFFYTSVRLRTGSLASFYIVIFGSTLLFSFYGLFQHFNLDFIKWNSLYNNITLTVGNPDFAAALLGLFVSILFALLFSEISRIFKLLVSAIAILAVVIIYWTQARQGLVAVALGTGLVLAGVLWQQNPRAAIGLLGAEFLAGLTSILGMLQIGPLTKFFFKSSITDRGYDWRAAWHMFTSHPWFGVGIDRYAGSFLKYRDPKYPLLYGYRQSVNNAHNVFLELFATCGVFVGLAYIGVIVFVAWRAFKAWKKYEGNQQILVTGVIAGWIVFVAQSVISVDSLSLSIWGWLLGGFIVGLSLDEGLVSEVKGNVAKKREKSSRLNQLVVFSILVLLFLKILVPMYQAESRTLNFQKLPVPTTKADQASYLAAANQAFNTRLISPDYKVIIAFSVTNAGLVNEGVSFFQAALKQDPKLNDANQFLGTIFEHFKNYPLAIKYRLAGRELNPWGADNLLQLENDYLLMGEKDSAREIRDSIMKMAPGSDLATKAQAAISG
jgi:O-antigen ligase